MHNMGIDMMNTIFIAHPNGTSKMGNGIINNVSTGKNDNHTHNASADFNPENRTLTLESTNATI